MAAATGLKLQRTDVAASGALVAAELWTDTPSADEKIAILSPGGLGQPLTGAVDCFLPASGAARSASLSPDSKYLAWRDAQGMKVAAAPLGPAEFCTPPTAPVIISPTGTSPSIGGARFSGSAPVPPSSNLTLGVVPKLTAPGLTKPGGVPLAVTVPATGKVTCTATVPAARIGKRGKPVVVAVCAAVNAAKAGTVTLKLKLNAAGRKAKKKLKGARLTIRIIQGTKTITRVVTIR